MTGREADDQADEISGRSPGEREQRERERIRTGARVRSAGPRLPSTATARGPETIARAGTTKSAKSATDGSDGSQAERKVPRRQVVPRSPARKSTPVKAAAKSAAKAASTPAPQKLRRGEPAAPDMPEIDTSGMHTMDGSRAEPMPRPVSRNLDPSQLYRGRARMALLRDIAMGEWSDSSIADSVGVPTEIITDFRETYEQEINEIKQALAGQLAIESAGLWISKKHNRISELQSDFEDIDLVIDVMRKNTKKALEENTIDSGSDSQIKGDTFDTDLLLGSRRHQNLLRAKIAVLRAVADEYAPNKTKKEDQAEDNSIRYVIEQDGPGPSGSDGNNDILDSLT